MLIHSFQVMYKPVLCSRVTYAFQIMWFTQINGINQKHMNYGKLKIMNLWIYKVYIDFISNFSRWIRLINRTSKKIIMNYDQFKKNI